ncbi:MAG: tetratricopeptide repeat protein [Deltaproteobacteria bacterium]|nr:tetratricopeptide repeat protein [Deltaproteobacteria bacterium]
MADEELISYYTQIEHYVEIGRYGSAENLLGKALAKYPNDTLLLLFKAKTEEGSGSNAQALSTVRELLTKEPGHFEARVLLAKLLDEAGDLSGSELTLIGLLKEYPEAASLYASYSNLMLKTHNHEKAWLLAKEGLRFDPESHACKVVCVLIDMCHGKVEGASAGVSELFRDDPDALHVAWLLIMILEEKGRYKEALRVAREVLRQTPADADAVKAVIGLKVKSHWTMLPLYPLLRYGWTGSAAVWIAAMAFFGILQIIGPPPAVAVVFIVLWVGYVIMSWVWPPALTKWIERRGAGA